jgi:CBS domain-containing protein
MRIADVMTKDVGTCRSGDSLNRAAQLMWERRCGCVPVVDEADRLIGVITDRDICMGAYTQGRRLDDIAVTVAMSSPVQTCAPSTSVEEAENLMMAHGVRRLLVVEDGRVSGIVSLDDVARSGAVWDGKGEIDLERVALALGEIARRTVSTDEEGPEREGSEISALVQNSLSTLKTLRDEIRVDVDLARKEVRDRWRRLEARLEAAETRAHETRREGAQSLAALVESAREFKARLRQETASTAKQRRS